MNNLKLLAWVKLHCPELNSLQIDKLRQKFNEVERDGRIEELERIVDIYTPYRNFLDSDEGASIRTYCGKRLAELQKGEL